MEKDSRAIIEAVIATKNELHNLLYTNQAEKVKLELENLLIRMENGENVEVEIWDLLGDYEATRNYFNTQLGKFGYDSDATKTRAYTPPPGDHTPPKPLGSSDKPRPK